MNCPTDNTPLQMTERQGIEIDYCPKCRGIWLDRGELDKIIEKSSQEAPLNPRGVPPSTLNSSYPDQNYGYGGHHGGGYYKKRKSFLSELFD